MWASAEVPDGLQLGERSNSFRLQDSSAVFTSSGGIFVSGWESGKYKFAFDAVAGFGLTGPRLGGRDKTFQRRGAENAEKDAEKTREELGRWGIPDQLDRVCFERPLLRT